jgi:transcription-repair coupling factor (superfamily II helicase)
MQRFSSIIEKLKKSPHVEGTGSSESVFLVSLLAGSNTSPLLWVLPDNSSCERAAQELSTFLADGENPVPVLIFPEIESSYYQAISPHPSTAVRRALTLWQLCSGFDGIVLTTVKSLLTLLPPPERLFSHCIHLETGSAAEPGKLVTDLRDIGYTRADSVTETGTFSTRGGIVDVFSTSSEHPLRIDFFGDEIDSIREFNASSQRSIRMLPECEIIPVREIIVLEEDLERWNTLSFEYWKEVKYAEDLEEKFSFTRLKELFNGFEFLFPVLHSDHVSLFDYFQVKPSLIISEPEKALEGGAEILKQEALAHESCVNDGVISLSPDKLMHSPGWWNQQVAECEFSFSAYAAGKYPDQKITRLSFQPERIYNSNFKDLLHDLESSGEKGETTVFIMPSSGLAERLVEIASEYDVILPWCRDGFPSAVEMGSCVIKGWVREGFYLPEQGLHVLSDTEIFGKEKSKPGMRRKDPSGNRIDRFLPDFRDMEPGNLIVHVEHGIGVFKGLKRLGIGNEANEFVVISYLGDDKLYVPVDRLDMLQKYSGGGASTPRLDRLGGTSWEKTKQKVKKSIQDMAESLIKLYAKREVSGGFAHSRDDALSREFEDAFPFELTPDQASSIVDIKNDMESTDPMDRLVCGDVGYGKTEVAMRAAFKAVNSGKQVAILAPTTVLAFQHLQTFRDRFSGFPVNIEMLSRFVTRSSQKDIIEKTGLGLVDILIGTHRLLSRDTSFNDLGLIIIDEEQRFGVAHKEKLKKLKVQADVLTLSATPIPRTLNMSLVGIRDLSIIETPPKDRLSIYTVVTDFSERLIRSALDLEIKRNGQAFFVHNEVKTIYSLARKIQSFVPEARVCVAHGQMKEKMLEDIMMDFLHYKYDVMVCTTIIENGLDISRANTMIINQAHCFGLSQLYQLRGRIGRSDRRAYAYLLAPKQDRQSPEAEKRLAAIRNFSDLGSGFRLAAMDLEIRGAGNFLGGQQSGHITAIGFDLYTKLLREAVSLLSDEDYTEDFRTIVDLKLDINIPEHYIDESSTRLWLYKRISSVPTLDEMNVIREETVDRFGKYPKSVTNLFEYATIRIIARGLGITAVEKKGKHLNLAFHKDTPVTADIVMALAGANKNMSISRNMAISIELGKTKNTDIFLEVKSLFKGLSG